MAYVRFVATPQWVEGFLAMQEPTFRWVQGVFENPGQHVIETAIGFEPIRIDLRFVAPMVLRAIVSPEHSELIRRYVKGSMFSCSHVTFSGPPAFR